MFAALLAGRDLMGLGREGGAVILFAVFSSLLLLSRPIIKLIYKLLSWEQPSRLRLVEPTRNVVWVDPHVCKHDFSGSQFPADVGAHENA